MYKKNFISIDFLSKNENENEFFFKKINKITSFLSKIDKIDKHLIGKKLAFEIKSIFEGLYKKKI